MSDITSSISSLNSHKSANTKSQFKNTAFWNNIIAHLLQTLKQNNVTSRLHRQQSRLDSMVGEMLLKSKNWRHHSTSGLDKTNVKYENICFSGSQCVDIVFSFLSSSDQASRFQQKVTREKVNIFYLLKLKKF